MPRKAPESRYHFLDIYKINLHLATTAREFEGLRNELDSVHPMPEGGAIAAMTSSHRGDTDGVGSYHVAFWIDRAQTENAGPAAIANVCAHEATHAAAMIHGYVNEDLDVDSEIHAYLVGWLTEWLYGHVTEGTS